MTHPLDNETTYYEASQCPTDPDNFWIDDVTGERINAETGERTYRTEMTPAGEQCVIPGCELNNFKPVRSQLDLF